MIKTKVKSLYSGLDFFVFNLQFRKEITMSITKLRTIVKDMVKQGPTHEKNIEMILDILYTACQNEFTEDNTIILKAYLHARLTTVLNKH